MTLIANDQYTVTLEATCGHFSGADVLWMLVQAGELEHICVQDIAARFGVTMLNGDGSLLEDDTLGRMSVVHATLPVDPARPAPTSPPGHDGQPEHVLLLDCSDWRECRYSFIVVPSCAASHADDRVDRL